MREREMEQIQKSKVKSKKPKIKSPSSGRERALFSFSCLVFARILDVAKVFAQ
jgi:hypothetical protein